MSSSEVATDRVFHALADATRRDILSRAGCRDDQSVSALARNYPISVTAVQKHVTVLENAGLVRKVRRGREQIVVAQPDALEQARRLLDQLEDVWRARIEQFNDVLDQSMEEE